MSPSVCVQVFLTSWWLFVITVVTYYSGALVALIIIPQQEPTYTDFASMLWRDRMTWGFQVIISSIMNAQYYELKGVFFIYSRQTLLSNLTLRTLGVPHWRHYFGRLRGVG